MGHNHPFFIGNHDVGGTVVPSEPDIEAFRNWEREFGTKRAWITNGFTVFSLSAPEFPLFSPPE